MSEEQPQQEPEIETEGSGKFEFPDGSLYEGQWKLVDGKKIKHGNGKIIVASSIATQSAIKEEYEGTWVDDRMEGEGIYMYRSGCRYVGEWLNNLHHGFGKYYFPDGCIYEGQWVEHKMEGEGVFIDLEGNRWEGLFVQGNYQSKIQAQLRHEKMMRAKEELIKEDCLKFFTKFQEAFAKSDKKTFKENLLPFFVTTEETKQYVKDPYPKFEERTPDKWNDVLKLMSEYTSIKVLREASQAEILEGENILVPQFNGLGQIVEFKKQIEERLIRLVICNAFEDRWLIVFYHDSEPEVPAKKK